VALPQTFYGRAGDIPAVILVALAMLVAARRRGRKRTA